MSILFTAESPSTQGSAWVTELNRYLLHWKFEFPDSPGGPGVPNPPASAGHSCLSPGLGDSTRGATSTVTSLLGPSAPARSPASVCVNECLAEYRTEESNKSCGEKQQEEEVNQPPTSAKFLP